MSLEEYGLNEKEKAKAASGSAEKAGPDLKEILSDKKQSILFAEERGRAGDGDAFKRYLEGKYDADDVKELGKQVEEFNGLMAEADRLTKMLSGKDLEQIMDSSPEMKKIASLNKEGIREVFGKYLPEMAIRDRDHFDRIVRKMEDREATRARGASYDEAIAKFCRKFGIDEKKYFELAEPGNEERLEEVVRAKLGRWRNFMGGSQKTLDAIDDELAALPDRMSVENYLEELEDERREIGDALSVTLVESDTMKEALSAETQGLRIGERGEEVDMAFDDVRKALKTDQKAMKDRFDKFEKDHKNDVKYQNAGGVYDRDLLIDDFTSEEAGPILKGKKGFWKDMFKEVMFPNFIERLI